MVNFSETISKLDEWTKENNRSTLGKPVAAVMIPMFERNGHLHLILTKRSEKMRKHSGQISFPGGKIDETDKDTLETAKREMMEEIGLNEENIIRILGKFHDFSTPYYDVVTPILAIVKPSKKYIISEEELSEVLEVPLDDLLDPQIHHTEDWIREDKHYNVHFYDWWLNGQEYVIWGATAGVIHQFIEIIKTT